MTTDSAQMVYIVSVTTDAADTYLFAYREKPDHYDLAERVWQIEGMEEDVDWYVGSISVKYEYTSID